MVKIIIKYFKKNFQNNVESNTDTDACVYYTILNTDSIDSVDMAVNKLYMHGMNPKINPLNYITADAEKHFKLAQWNLCITKSDNTNIAILMNLPRITLPNTTIFKGWLKQVENDT